MTTTTPEEIGREEFAAILERNGHHTAAAAVLAGVDYTTATAYLWPGTGPRYDDGEGHWLHDFLHRLHDTR